MRQLSNSSPMKITNSLAAILRGLSAVLAGDFHRARSWFVVAGIFARLKG